MKSKRQLIAEILGCQEKSAFQIVASIRSCIPIEIARRYYFATRAYTGRTRLKLSSDLMEQIELGYRTIVYDTVKDLHRHKYLKKKKQKQSLMQTSLKLTKKGKEFYGIKN